MSGGAKSRLSIDAEQRGYIDSRILDVEKAATRSRWIYGAMSLLSVLLFSVAYNEYFSWQRGMALGLPSDFVPTKWSDQLYLLLLREWVSTLQFDVPYLGGKFGVSDAGVVGGVVLLLAAIWCYYSARRENRQVYFLVKDFSEFDFSHPERFYLCNQLYSTQLFVHESPRGAYSAHNIDSKKTERSAREKSARKAGWLERFMSHLLKAGMFAVFMTPVLALSFVFVTDVTTLLHVSPFRNDGHILYWHVCGNEDVWAFWRCKDRGFLERMLLSLALTACTSAIMWKAWRFQRGTERLIFLTLAWKRPLLDSLRSAAPAAPATGVQ